MTPNFIILSSRRTGSTVIRRALDSHSQLSVIDEVFSFAPNDHLAVARREEITKVVYPNTKVELDENSNLVPLIDYIFVKYNGFKLQRDEQIALNNPTWGYLAARKDVKIIHLSRRNKLRQLISFELAKKSNVWHVENNEEVPKPNTLRLNPIESAQYFVNWLQEEDHFHNLFQAHETIDIWYEDFERNIQGVLGSVQKFLGVQPEQLKIPTKKMVSEPVSEIVENFDELCKFFAGSEWERMLKD